MRLLAFVFLLTLLFAGVMSGQEIYGMAIVANNPKSLGVSDLPIVGDLPVVEDTAGVGHLAFAYQDPLDGLFVFGSVGMDFTKPTNLIDPAGVDINKKYTFDELKTYLAENGYTSYKVFYVENPEFDDAIDAENELSTANYNLFASITKPITDPFSHAVNADDENCLTATKKVLEAYGVDMPDWDILTPAPNTYYATLAGDIYYPDSMGDDPIVPTNYEKSTSPTTPIAALAALGIGTPQLSPSDSSIIWLSDPNEDVPETSGETYFDKANDVWYIDAFEWHGDRGLYDKPAAPYRFVSGELNTWGYNWIYLPFERTGLTYDQGYYDWAAETLASMGMPGPTAGYGTLV